MKTEDKIKLIQKESIMVSLDIFLADLKIGIENPKQMFAKRLDDILFITKEE